MSQNLHIGETKETFYDCVLVNNQNVREKLIKEWVFYGITPGPLKIRITDWGLWDQVKGVIAELISDINKQWPNNVWMFYYKDKEIEHPTIDELEEWIKGMKNEF